MEYDIIKVQPGGVAKTGLTTLINDRDTSLTVPWAVSETGTKNIVWNIKSNDGNTYTVTVPVKVTASNNSPTVSYTAGTYTRVKANGTD